MNYRHVYMCIIAHAKKETELGLRPRTYWFKKDFPNQYFEFHHILPKSLFPNWRTRQSNLIALTAREHFFCHQLLMKIYPCAAMGFAITKMMPNIAKHRSSKDYERIRKQVAVLCFGKGNPFYGKHHNAESNRKNAEWHHLHPNSKEVMDRIHQKNVGQKRTAETKKKMTESALKRDNSLNSTRIKELSCLYNKYKENGGSMSWNEFQKLKEMKDEALRLAKAKNS